MYLITLDDIHLMAKNRELFRNKIAEHIKNKEIIDIENIRQSSLMKIFLLEVLLPILYSNDQATVQFFSFGMKQKFDRVLKSYRIRHSFEKKNKTKSYIIYRS